MHTRFIASVFVYFMVVPAFSIRMLLKGAVKGSEMHHLKRRCWQYRLPILAYAAFAPFMVVLTTLGPRQLVIVYLIGCLMAYLLAFCWLDTKEGRELVDDNRQQLFLIGVALASYVGISLVLRHTPWLRKPRLPA